MSRQKLIPILLASFALAGCELFEGQGQVSFSIASTDPVDPDGQFDEVVVAASKLVFVSAEGERETIEIAPAEQINLLELTRGDSARLITDETLPSARYDSVEITIDSDDSSNSSSFIRYADDNSTASLFIPDDQQSKLTLPVDFEIEDGETTTLTLQFELRQSLRRESAARYELHPSLCLVDDAEVGAISGTVSSSLVPNGCVPAIYAFAGSNAIPDDIDGSGITPLSTARVFEDSGDNGEAFVYALGFLDEDSYTLAYTCKADEEDPTQGDDLDFFVLDTRPKVEAGETTTLNITPDSR